MRYYKNYWIFMNNPLAGAYLKWAYKNGINDFTKLNFKPDFNKDGFSCLLCGVGNERTAKEFIEFVNKKNTSAIIYIIDIEEVHLDAIRKLISKKYSHLNIHVEKINALDLEKIIDIDSIDWIETDGFMEFFDTVSLHKLLSVWFKILKSDGFITTRDYINSGKWNKIMNPLRDIIMKGWLGVNIYKHSEKDFDSIFLKTNFLVNKESTFIPTYKRFSLIKNPKVHA